jgi:hypothetical protein
LHHHRLCDVPIESGDPLHAEKPDSDVSFFRNTVFIIGIGDQKELAVEPSGGSHSSAEIEGVYVRSSRAEKGI